jgi:hypothetical protein
MGAMTTTRFGWIGLAALVVLGGTTSAAAQEIGTVTGSPGPGVPYVTEPVLPDPNVRLQTHFVPVTRHVAEDVSVDDFLVPFRLYGAMMMTDSVVGEASIPFLLTFPGTADGVAERDTGFDLGNPRIGFEWPIFSVGQRHRISLSFDMFLPFSQISLGDSELDLATGTIRRDPQDVADALERRGRYGLAATLLPQLAPDFLPETFTVMPGVHYRFRQAGIVTHLNLDIPAYLGFDFSQPKFFHENFLGLRYGLGFTYEARPVYPSLEITGVTTFAHDDPAALPEATPVEIETTTALLATLGVRFAFGTWEPGVAVTYPITLGGDVGDMLDPVVYIHFELAYRFQ